MKLIERKKKYHKNTMEILNALVLTSVVCGTDHEQLRIDAIDIVDLLNKIVDPKTSEKRAIGISKVIESLFDDIRHRLNQNEVFQQIEI